MKQLHKKTIYIFFCLFLSLFPALIPKAKSQLSFVKEKDFTFFDFSGYSEDYYESNIAYKIPFRGNNYKFYGTLNYHIYGNAYASCRVHNTLVEAYHLSEYTCKSTNFKILKGSRHKSGRLQANKTRKSGNVFYFMSPMKKKGKALKYYYRTGLFRFLLRFNKAGQLKSNSNICIDV